MSHAPAVPCIVTLVGFGHKHSEKWRGFLQRCGLLLMEFDDPKSALQRLRRQCRADAIVVNGRSAAIWNDVPSTLSLLDFAAAAPWDGVPLPVFLLTGRGTPRELADACAGGAVRLRPKQQRFREILLRVRKECRLDDDCCGWREASASGEASE